MKWMESVKSRRRWRREKLNRWPGRVIYGRRQRAKTRYGLCQLTRLKPRRSAAGCSIDNDGIDWLPGTETGNQPESRRTGRNREDMHATSGDGQRL